MRSRVWPARAALAALVAAHVFQIAGASGPAPLLASMQASQAATGEEDKPASAAASGPEEASPAATVPTAEGTPAPYRDRVIDAASLPQLPELEDEDALDTTQGPPRSLRVEAVLSVSERGDDEPLRENGVVAAGFWRTANWGDFSLDATLFRRSGQTRDAEGWGGASTLWQRGMVLSGQGRLDTGLGVQNSPLLPLQRNQFRFFLPSAPLAGLSTQWANATGDRMAFVAAGRAGSYTGTRLLGFDLADGAVTSVGTQWRTSPAWTTAASFLGTQGRIVPDEDGQATFLPDQTRAVHVATQWESKRASVQANALLSDADAGQASGVWVDGQWRRGRLEHQAGVFSLEPDLAWGALPINQDLRGGYYRLAYQFARWQWSAGVDDVGSISGNGFDGQYVTGFARYQVNTRLGIGGSLNARIGEETATGMQLFADHATDWGTTRWQFDQARSGGDNGDSWQASVDQSFPLQQGRRLSTTLGYGQVGSSEGSTSTGTVSINGGADLTDALTLDASLRWTHGAGYSAVRGTDVNIAANWRLDHHWSLAATFYQSQGSQRSPFVLDPIENQTPFISLPRDRSLWLSVRYQRDAGRPQGVLGGAPDSAAGEIAGSVFLDENRDGQRNASELPAAQLTVILDGRYSVRTDVDGRFVFPRVAVGTHRLQVLPDNLPLPWSLPDAAASQTVDVVVRQQARIDIGASRP